MSRIQELWPDWWREPKFDRVTADVMEKLAVEGPSRLDGKERRNLIRWAIEQGAVIALERETA